MLGENDRADLATVAALDAAQQQLAASADALLIEHLQVVAQRRVDDKLTALPERLKAQAAGRRYVVSVSRAPTAAPEA